LTPAAGYAEIAGVTGIFIAAALRALLIKPAGAPAAGA
jgi:hypothetical protein